jgi:hypothetical protein
MKVSGSPRLDSKTTVAWLLGVSVSTRWLTNIPRLGSVITILVKVRHAAALLKMTVLPKLGSVSEPSPANGWFANLLWAQVSHWEQILCATRGNIYMMMKNKNRVEIAKDHFQCEKGDAEAAIDGVGP